ncbi:hypothetical protein [Trujillonella humicola]|uniref:hypothetical protein n=1 Tax=Trujillonella humicola TaxID=3383699 RepID=UPI003906CAA8
MCSSSGSGVDEAGLHALPDGELLAEVAAAVAAQNRAAARLATVVRVADARTACEHDGLKTMQAWLRTHAGLKGATAAGLVHRGRALALLPATAAAFAAARSASSTSPRSPRSPRPGRWRWPPRRTSTWPRSTRHWPPSRPGGPSRR